MAGKIVQFKKPDGRLEEGKITTSYRVVNGPDFMISETGNKVSDNYVFGVSYKPIGEERFSNIINVEDWINAKKNIVDILHNNMENLEYTMLGDTVLLTEDYKHDLALKDDTAEQLENDYKAFLNAYNASVESVAPQEQSPESIVVSPVPSEQTSDLSQPPVEPGPALNPIPEPALATTPQNMNVSLEQPQAVVEPVVPTPVINETPVVNNVITPEFNNGSVVEPQPVVDTPVISETPVDNGIFASTPVNQNDSLAQQPSTVAQTPTQTDNSSVVKYYSDLVKSLDEENEALIRNFEDLNNKYKELMQASFDTTDKILENCKKMRIAAKEMGSKSVEIILEANEMGKLSVRKFDQAQQYLESQSNDEMTRDLTKSA